MCRSELVHMLDHLSGELRESVPSKDTPAFALSGPDRPVEGLPSGYKDCSLQVLPPADVLALPCSYNTPGTLHEGVSASNFPLLDPRVPAVIDQSRNQTNNLLPLDPQPSGTA